MSAPQLFSALTVMEPDDVDTLILPGLHSPWLVECFGMTHRGKKRSNNEDQFLIAALDKVLHVEGTSLPLQEAEHSSDQSYLFVVADGVAGNAGGEEASTLAVDAVEKFTLESLCWFSQVQGNENDKLLAEFRTAVGQANARVLAESAKNPELRGMATTLTLAYNLNDKLYVAHVGDSRCYLFRRKSLYRLTSDHTLVEDMIQKGALSAEEASQHQWRHIITNAVGGATPQVKVEVHKLQLEDDDRILLCSDGLTGMLTEDEIAQILQQKGNAKKACRQLVTRANQAGGKDNITVVVARFTQGKPLATAGE